MISQIALTGVHFELDDKLKQHIGKKIGRLDRFIPKVARKTVRAEVTVREDAHNQAGDTYYCEVLLRLPGGQAVAKESTLTVFAAVDIVEAKLKAQLKKYSAIHNAHIRTRRGELLHRLSLGLFGKGIA